MLAYNHESLHYVEDSILRVALKILTFGWDYPPIKNGGLGVACYGLTTELVRRGIEVIFVLPRTQEVDGSARFIFANKQRGIRARVIDSPLKPYLSSNSPLYVFEKDGTQRVFARNLIEEVYHYAAKAGAIASEEEFDIIHAHDWTSYLAGLAAKEVTGKPLIVHVHATSYDQAGSKNVDPEVYKIEMRAFEEADCIVTVSQLTKDIIVREHGADPEKIVVVHNGCSEIEPVPLAPVLSELKSQGKKIVLFHGRITIQKGPDYFVRAARRVVDIAPNTVFVVSGWGDMEHQVMQLVGALGLSSNVIFAGALWDEERDRMYQSADLLVMPSVSEPFGLVALEAIQHGTPALISKQSGVSEVLTNVLKVDFWDVEEMANKIVALLRYSPLDAQLTQYGRSEARRNSWGKAAHSIKELYEHLSLWSQTSKSNQ